MSINTDSFTIFDPFPQKSIEEISSYADKSDALYCRNKKLIKEGFLQIIGAIFALQGLEYHYNNFINLTQKINPKSPIDLFTNGKIIKDSSHEMIAYLNRLGQFREFYKSKLFNKYRGIKKSEMKKYLYLRDNYSAHRAIDRINHNEQDYYLEILMSVGSLWNKNGNREFQYQDKKGKWVRLDLKNEHKLIMKEAYTIIEAIILDKK
jgi:hypothetical protein